ncbi:MAG: carbamoyltransferase, partial [Candidatus Omnitrophica bacterium]|nr:carbamoyltransferase [Candidatus Omnitrophota bacterium]
MNILGVSCFYHDSAAALLKDGKIVAAAQEERFNRSKNSPDFPIQAINYCLQSQNLTIGDIDYIGFYEKPFLKFSRVVLNHLKTYPFSLKNFLDTLPYWLQDRLIMPLVFKRELGFEGKVIFIKHHLSHAASAFLASGFDEAAIFTADGVGEWTTATLGFGKANEIKIEKEMIFPDSLGLLYTAVTTYLGFEALEGEGKVMGLAGYGKPVYLDQFMKIIRTKPDGSFKIDQSYFGFYNEGCRMYKRKFVKMFGKEREREGRIEQRHCDIAASLQKFVEDTLIKISLDLHKMTKAENLCLAGGLFLNCVANQKILDQTPFKRVFIQPAAGDSGGSIGTALYIYNSILKNPRSYEMTDAYLGPCFLAAEIKRTLINKDVKFKEFDEEDLCRYIAGKISEGKIIGWFQGRMEIGPRALGNRSILADPRNPDMKELINSRVKNREPFRPYAPVVLEEKAADYFKMSNLSPFMLLAPEVREEKKKIVPAVTHVDGTARVQTVNRNANPRLYRLIEEFGKITGVHVIINTSFNLRGEPVVCTPENALNSFLKTKMDCLVL